jgi:hypothetical protein
MNIGHLNKSMISYRNIIDGGLILMCQNSMAKQGQKRKDGR